MFYKLVGHDPVQCANVQIWAEWFESAGESRIVAQDEFDGFLVSTAFIGIDPSAEDRRPPLLFETMTFRDGRAGDFARYARWSEAEDGHRAAVKRARKTAARPETV